MFIDFLFIVVGVGMFEKFFNSFFCVIGNFEIEVSNLDV